MAYFEQRKNGWLAQIRRKGMPSISRTFDTKADAEAWAREIERELQRGNLSVLRQDAQRTTVAQIGKRYIEQVAAHKRDHSAAALVRRAIERFGSYSLANVRPVDVAAWRDELLAQGYAPQSVVHFLNALSAIFRFAEQDLSIDLPQGNPARSVRKPRVQNARDRRLKPGEMDYLLRAAEQARSQVAGLPQIIALAVETSMRLGELLALEWQHVQIRDGDGTAYLPLTKNGEARTVALSPAAIAALQAIPRRVDGRVFGWARTDSFEKTWARCKARARALYEVDCAERGVEPDPAFLSDLHFHDLRHEATSRLFELGLDSAEVAAMTGHKSPSMLARYTHIDASHLSRKLAKLRSSDGESGQR